MIRKVCDGSWVDSWDWPTSTLPRGRRLPLSIPDVNHCPNSYSSVKVQILLFLIKGAQKFGGNSAYLQNMFYFTERLLTFSVLSRFFRGSYHKIMPSLAKHFENREANIRYDPFSLCPTSFLQPSWVMEPPRIFFLYMSASAGFKRYLIFKTSTYVVNILSNVPAPADLYIWAPSAWTCPAQVRRCCFKKSWGVTQPKRRKPVCPACPVWRAPTERFCCVQQIFHSRRYHFLCGYFHWASTCKCRKRRLG